MTITVNQRNYMYVLKVSVSSTFEWMCSISYVVSNVCYMVKFLDNLCELFEFLNESIFGAIRHSRLKNNRQILGFLVKMCFYFRCFKV